MKKLIKDPGLFVMLGLLGAGFACGSDNLYVNIILVPIFFLLQFIGIAYLIKKYLKEKKDVSNDKTEISK